MSLDSAQESWCTALYEAQASALLLYGRALGLSHAEAEDVLHEVFQALLRLEEAPQEPNRYAVRAFRHRALNRHRSIWRRLTLELQARCWFETDSGTTDQEREAMTCLARLPSDQREVLVLKFWHDHTFEEIGTLLGISPNTAAGRYRYGLEKLRTALQTNTLESAFYERSLDPESTSFLAAPASVTRT